MKPPYGYETRLEIVKKADEAGKLDRVCTPKQARRIRAYYLEGKPLREIAQKEGVKKNRVYTAIQRGLANLEKTEKKRPATRNPCKNCKYSFVIGDHKGQQHHYCQYILLTGERRPCPPGKGCTVKA